MKKSQMINEIASVIKDTMLLSETNMATAVLNKMEELGMKPTSNVVNDTDLLYSKSDSNFYLLTSDGLEKQLVVNEGWEKENA